MEGHPESRPVKVTSAEVAEVLRRVQNVQQLRHFMTPAGSTVTAFARAFGFSVVRAYRQVRTFERLGLLTLQREERRAGRAVRWYRCPARQYFLPAGLISLEDYLHDSFQPHESRIKGQLALAVQDGPAPVAGLLVGASGEDGVALVPADALGQPWTPDAPGTPAVVFGLSPLYLDYPQAKALQGELQGLYEKYGQGQGAARYVLQVILTPFGS